jgi:hypothetical protein
MAKIGFGSLKITKVDDRVNTFTFNEKEIEVKRYLPFSDKLTLIGNAINLAADGNRFANPMKIDMYLDLEIMFAYTNITFTDKQKEDLVKLYDMLASAGFFEAMYSAIAEEEASTIHYNAARLAENMYGQMNSVYGIMENIVSDYTEVDMDATNIQEKLANPENLTLLKNVMTKLG